MKLKENVEVCVFAVSPQCLLSFWSSRISTSAAHNLYSSGFPTGGVFSPLHEEAAECVRSLETVESQVHKGDSLNPKP